MARGAVIKAVKSIDVSVVKVPGFGTVKRVFEVLPADAGFRLVTEVNGNRQPGAITVSPETVEFISAALAVSDVEAEVALHSADA